MAARPAAVLRETFLWGMFCCLLVPLFLVWSGVPVGTALVTTAALLALGILIYLALKVSGMPLTNPDPGTDPGTDPGPDPEPDLEPDLEPDPASRPEPAPGPRAAAPAGPWSRDTSTATYRVEAGWADDRTSDGRDPGWTHDQYR